LNLLFKPLPPTDEDQDESPSPTSSKLPQYFWNKVSKSRKASKSSKPRRIPPSGTPVKLRPSTLSPGISIKWESDSSKSKVKTNPDLKSKLKVDPHQSSASSGCESDPDHKSSEMNQEMDQCIEETIQIAHLKPQFSEFTYLFPAFPKTHPNGYAYIIELSPEVLNENALVDLRDALQYSLTGGGGTRVLDNVKFFAVDGEKVPMKIHYRVCAGISSGK
jgi:hypothetical protein